MKIFEEILTNIEDLKKESYIKSILLEYNLSTIFSPIYATNKEVQRFGDVCTSFIILAYSNGCKWLDYRKDRKTVKMEVMKSVLQYTKVQIDDNYQVLISKVIDGQLEEVEMVIYDFVRWQRNGLFETYVALSTQISLCRREASSTFGVNAKTLNDRAKFLENLRALEKDLKDVVNEIEREFISLDESLKQENKKQVSAQTDFYSWEDVVKGLDQTK